MRALYSPCQAQVMANNFTSQGFCIFRGLRQGDPLSPALYNIAFEPLLARLCSRLPMSMIKMDNHKEIRLSSTLAYADDTSIPMDDSTTFTTIVRE